MLERLDAGGWALVVASLLITAPALLLPAWAEVDALRQQKQRLADHLTATHDATERAHRLIASVEHDDPMVLTRLAWQELHLKPAGAEPLGGVLPIDASPTSPVAPTHAAPPPTQPPTVLGHLVAGPNRVAFYIVGMALAGASLATSLRRRTTD